MPSMRWSCICAMLLGFSITSLLPAKVGAQPPVYIAKRRAMAM